MDVGMSCLDPEKSNSLEVQKDLRWILLWPLGAIDLFLLAAQGASRFWGYVSLPRYSALMLMNTSVHHLRALRMAGCSQRCRL
jgi:hypothetical protein